ncbi:hypothetical protein [Nocardioides campestrisoli]|uniref:hypothetical protein n=1 Tax=Nocardioides campestrisoli TaxID=2736757 RepID=UPI001C6343AB|nr:hypothetical protein [Nocardioides campestrisoli]
MQYSVRPISDRTAFAGHHRSSPFQSSWVASERLLLAEVKHLQGRDLVLELDIREQDLRLDGTLRANARPASPAVRVAFESVHGPLTYATDRFSSWYDNARAIALGLEALRKVDRYGITKRGEQYSGWKALPAGRAMPASHMTRDDALGVFGVWGRALPALPAIPAEHVNTDPDSLRGMYRSARRAAHPDRNNGDQTAWDQVEQAAAVLGVTR